MLRISQLYRIFTINYPRLPEVHLSKLLKPVMLSIFTIRNSDHNEALQSASALPRLYTKIIKPRKSAGRRDDTVEHTDPDARTLRSRCRIFPTQIRILDSEEKPTTCLSRYGRFRSIEVCNFSPLHLLFC